MTNNTSFVYPVNTDDKANSYMSYMPGYGDTSISNFPTQQYDYDNSKESTQDNAYIIFLLPKEAKAIKEIVAKSLDKLDYEGSVIYHEYPDKNDLQEVINKIYQQLENQMNHPNESTPNITPMPTIPTSSTTPSTPSIDESNTTSSQPVLTMQVQSSNPHCRGYDCPPPYYSPQYYPDGRPNWMRQLLESLFFDEMINRRRKYYNNMYR